MEGYSKSPHEERIEILKSLMPEVFDEGKIDFEKLKATLGEDVSFSNERYVLNWAGKSEAFHIMQRPSSATLIPSRAESVDFDTTQNIFIEGENMEVLKVLQKGYFGKVKMIYIDPPYNTGNDSFIYPDKFSETKEEYLKRVGDKDEEGYMTREGMFHKNSRENGQYHSNWLNMMMPRLYLAKSLLREDGVIFISIDDNEVHNLRLLMNEIFGEENFVAQFIWEKRVNRENRNEVSVRHDYVVCYSKYTESDVKRIMQTPMNEKALSNYSNPDNDPRGLWKSDPAHAQAGHGTKSQFYTLIAPNGKRHELPSGRCWLYTKDVMDAAIKDNRIWFGKDGNGVPRIKTFLTSKERGLTLETILFAKDASTNEKAKNDLKELFDGIAVFETPKPVELITILAQVALKDGLVLDFFAGSSATAHAVMQLNKVDGGNRRFICVQMAEPCDSKSEAYKAGYSNIAEISKERIRRASAKLRTEIESERAQKATELTFDNSDDPVMPDFGFKVFRLADSNFKQWRDIRGSEQQQWQQQSIDFINPVAENATIDNMVYELLLKNGKSLNSTIEHSDNCYIINSDELVLLLESIDQATVDHVLTLHPQKVIALDNLFSGNDQLKTNTALQLRDASIEFKTI